MSATFEICLLLYVIRVTGWLKHCSLSLSLSLTEVLNYIKFVIHANIKAGPTEQHAGHSAS